MPEVTLPQPDPDTDISRRYRRLFEAHCQGFMSLDEMNIVCFHFIAEQVKSGDLRHDRYIPPKTGNEDKEARESRERAEGMNAAGEIWIKRLGAFRGEFGYELSDKEDGWRHYIETGEANDDVAEYLNFVSRSVRKETDI